MQKGQKVVKIEKVSAKLHAEKTVPCTQSWPV